jgi:hypothetical protein
VGPPDLVTFDGREYATASEWEAAFDAFRETRERWRVERGLPEDALPIWRTIRDCPWDQSLI